jgi:1-deoxy-D-xylulose-5-phosphate synthase
MNKMSTLLNLPKVFDSGVGPKELKRMSQEELSALSTRLRQALVESVLKNGGHLSSNLGIVELTLALHKVFDSPKDKLVWDVGHQAYIHKMITGRKDQFKNLRQYRGLSGFVTPVESEHDSFIAGHSSTSISLAVGMAIARDRQKKKHKIVAIIGDGAMTGGMALEALNHLGHIQKDVIIVLNDNEMSISENLGGFSQYLKRIKGQFFYRDARNKHKIKKGTPCDQERQPAVWEFASASNSSSQVTLETPGCVFENLGINYSGPVDGHDINALVKALESIKDRPGPQLLHVITCKGKGYAPAEADAVRYHGVSACVEQSGSGPDKNSAAKASSYSEVFAETLIEIARKDETLVAITPATAEGTGVVEFAREFPERFYDVAICEQHAVTMAAGLAKSGLLPVVSIYSTFLQRAMDQVIHDVGILNLPVVFGIDRGGLVEDGQTHQGLFDISYMRAIPNMRVYAPKDAGELRNMLYTVCKRACGPAAIRFPRAIAVEAENKQPLELIEIDRWEVLKEGEGLILLAFGSMVEVGRDCLSRLEAQGLKPLLVNARSAKPLDSQLLDGYLRNPSNKIVTLEEGTLSGGFGSAVLEHAAALRLAQPGMKQAEIACLGIPDLFVEHGARSILLDLNGLSPSKVCEKVLQFASAR